MPICKMCYVEVDKLVKSHIVPKSFFEAMKGNSDHLIIVSNKNGEYTKKSRIGIYDQEILCISCEEKFKVIDDYGQEILLKNQNNFIPIVDPQNSEIVGWFLNKEIDNEKIKKFILSVLYRASLSERDFFEHISLGPYQEKIKNILESSYSNSNEFSIIIRKFKNVDALSQGLLDPRPVRINNLKFYKIYLGSGYTAYIKVDQQKVQEELDAVSVGKISKLHIIADNFEKSGELKVLRLIGKKLKKENK